MKLLVGLGNPGPQYETTRHNAGFLVLDLLAKHAGASWEGASSKLHGQVAKATLFGQRCLLLKPQTFMNRSGRAVGAAMRFYKLPARGVIVLHDDLDVAVGQVKAREGGGHGGHNGIRSIIEETGRREFQRMKIGIGRPQGGAGQDVSGWVLGRMSNEELLSLQQEVLAAVLLRLKGVFEKDPS